MRQVVDASKVSAAVLLVLASVVLAVAERASGGPCGAVGVVESNEAAGGGGPDQALAVVHTQLKTQRDLLTLRRVQAAYERGLARAVERADHSRDYWLPDAANVHRIKATYTSVKYALPQLLDHLQRFAVALELMLEQAATPACGRLQQPEALLDELNNRHRTLMCEVETGLLETELSATAAVGRDVMPSRDRAIDDCTNRALRDYGALLRYHRVLDAWVHYTRGYS